MCQVRQMAALPSQTVAAMEEGRAASAVARTAQAGAVTWLVPANTQQLACMEEGLPPAPSTGQFLDRNCVHTFMFYIPCTSGVSKHLALVIARLES